MGFPPSRNPNQLEGLLWTFRCPADLDTVTKIEAACFPPAEAAKRETMARRIAAFPHSFLIAELEGAPAGLINGCVTSQQTITDDLFADASLHNPDGAYQSVFGLCVLPDARESS